MSCKTQQSSSQKTTVVVTDTTTMTQVVAQDSASIIARVDSIIIIEEYNTDGQECITPCVSHNKPGMKCLCQKRNDTSQKEIRSLKKKIKIYGVNLSSAWLSEKDSLNKKMKHQEKTDTQIRQKTPMQKSVEGLIGYIIFAIVVIILVGYLIGKNAVQ